MSFDPQKVFRQLFDPKRFTIALRMLSNTKVFLADRLRKDKTVAPAISVYAFCLAISTFLLMAVLDRAQLRLESAFKFAVSNVLLVLFLGLSGHLALKSVKAPSDYAKVVQSTFYLYGPAQVLTALGAAIWFEAAVTQSSFYLVGLLFMVCLTIYWFCRAWGSLACALGCTRRQSVFSFVLANVYFVPIVAAFAALSGVLGRTV